MNYSCLVVMYHYVRDVTRTRFPALKALSPVDFKRQLDWLSETYRIIGYPDLQDVINGSRSLATDEALLTFDDGFRDHFDIVFPILQKRGLSGLFFVGGTTLEADPKVLNVHKTHFLLATLGVDRFVTALNTETKNLLVSRSEGLRWKRDVYRYDEINEQEIKHILNYEIPITDADKVLKDLFGIHIGNEVSFAKELYLNRDQIKQMSAAGMTFGFHTQRHRVLSRLSLDEQRAELSDGVKLIRKLTNQQAVPFCFPYGHAHTYNNDTLDVLGEIGYAAAFNTIRRQAIPGKDTIFEIPRFDTRDLPPFKDSLMHA